MRGHEWKDPKMDTIFVVSVLLTKRSVAAGEEQADRQAWRDDMRDVTARRAFARAEETRAPSSARLRQREGIYASFSLHLGRHSPDERQDEATHCVCHVERKNPACPSRLPPFYHPSCLTLPAFALLRGCLLFARALFATAALLRRKEECHSMPNLRGRKEEEEGRKEGGEEIPLFYACVATYLWGRKCMSNAWHVCPILFCAFSYWHVYAPVWHLL